MRELRLAIPASIDPVPRQSTAGSLSRRALVVSVLVHLVGVIVASRLAFVAEEIAPPPPLAGFLVFSPRVEPPRSAPLPAETLPVVAPAAPVVETPAAPESRAHPEAEPAVPRAVPQVQPERSIAIEPSVGVAPPLDAPRRVVVPSAAELAEARERAAAEVIEERSRQDSYLTFSVDDVAPPRPDADPEPQRSIFDGTGASRRSVGEVGQARTAFGRRVTELCNALTGGFGLLGVEFCASPDDEPSGLFPEVRPAYLDLVPECAESAPEQPELAAASPFSTVKCRLVRQEIPPRGVPR
jgi:hypothetical protein